MNYPELITKQFNYVMRPVTSKLEVQVIANYVQRYFDQMQNPKKEFTQPRMTEHKFGGIEVSRQTNRHQTDKYVSIGTSTQIIRSSR